MEISQMTEINSLFEQAAIAAKSLPERPDNDTLLQRYALFKQGSAGGERLQGLSQDDARNQYIDLVRKLGGSVDD
jgi:acyl-CoA-binding protein